MFRLSCIYILRPLQKSPSSGKTQTQVFGYFHAKYPLNPPRIPDNQASGPPFRRQQAHLAC
ncbi:hypothetical protein CYK00_00090 [Neisseria sicca]|uniref:Uncharacterized protein n=1 Tax=Neisseria sicca TaxID=490 RepID=A0A2I1XEL2_NEISI|nr:hypothetical protein CYK00_00090 [Neisseria sicca]